MGMSSFDPNDPRVQLEVYKERLRYTEENLRTTEVRLEKIYTDLGKKDEALERMRTDRDEWRLKYEGVAKDLKHTQELLKNERQVLTDKRNKSKKSIQGQGRTGGRVESGGCVHFKQHRSGGSTSFRLAS
jgi:chromosome segregation ATPase